MTAKKSVCKMKYLITESQYNKAIDRFITHHLEPHEEKPLGYGDVMWLKNRKIVAETSTPLSFYVTYDIWNSISSMFSLSFKETVSVIETWLEKHYPNMSGLIPNIAPYR